MMSTLSKGALKFTSERGRQAPLGIADIALSVTILGKDGDNHNMSGWASPGWPNFLRFPE